jgi:hypothetical protein
MRPWFKSLFELGMRHGIRAALGHGVRDADGRDYIPRFTGDGLLCLVEALVLVDPYLFFFQAAAKAFDIAVAFGMVVGGAAVLDAG